MRRKKWSSGSHRRYLRNGPQVTPLARGRKQFVLAACERGFPRQRSLRRFFLLASKRKKKRT